MDELLPLVRAPAIESANRRVVQFWTVKNGQAQSIAENAPRLRRPVLLEDQAQLRVGLFNRRAREAAAHEAMPAPADVAEQKAGARHGIVVGGERDRAVFGVARCVHQSEPQTLLERRLDAFE